MAIDLKGLNQAQLNELINRAESRKGELVKEKVVKVREKVSLLLKSEGVTFDEVFGGGAAKRRRRPAVAKYRNPGGSETWSGRGKRPRWFNAALAAGKKEKDMLI